MIRGHERLNRNTHRNTTFSYLYLETGLKLKKKKKRKSTILINGKRDTSSIEIIDESCNTPSFNDDELIPRYHLRNFSEEKQKLRKDKIG